jgi:hypothetical protein
MLALTEVNAVQSRGGPRVGASDNLNPHCTECVALVGDSALVCDDPAKTWVRTEIQPSAERAFIRSISELWLTS